MLGYEHKIWGPLSLNIQGFYKSLFNLTQRSGNTAIRNGIAVEERFSNNGRGKAYGAEILLRYNADGRFSGWITYSYTKSKREFLNSAGEYQEFLSNHDQPHNLTALGTIELFDVWEGLSAGFRLRFGSGNPYSRIIGSIYYADYDTYGRISTKSNNARLPNFFELDLRFDKKWTFNKWFLSVYIDVLNVTDYKNYSESDSISYNFDYSEYKLKRQFPPRFPTVGFSFEY